MFSEWARSLSDSRVTVCIKVSALTLMPIPTAACGRLQNHSGSDTPTTGPAGARLLALPFCGRPILIEERAIPRASAARAALAPIAKLNAPRTHAFCARRFGGAQRAVALRLQQDAGDGCDIVGGLGVEIGGRHRES